MYLNFYDNMSSTIISMKQNTNYHWARFLLSNFLLKFMLICIIIEDKITLQMTFYYTRNTKLGLFFTPWTFTIQMSHAPLFYLRIKV